MISSVLSSRGGKAFINNGKNRSQQRTKKQAPAECLNPQPEAHVVFQRVLDWIDRCDAASQTGAPKPEFQTTSGEPIFPEGEEPWWLTDISRRLGQDAKQQEVDEDGPASDGEGKDEEKEDEQKELSDDDPSSEPEQVSASASSSAYDPNVAWHRMET